MQKSQRHVTESLKFFTIFIINKHKIHLKGMFSSASFFSGRIRNPSKDRAPLVTFGTSHLLTFFRRLVKFFDHRIGLQLGLGQPLEERVVFKV